jgi:DNA-directed RNA polymerase subunit E'/Rpb7
VTVLVLVVAEVVDGAVVDVVDDGVAVSVTVAGGTTGAVLVTVDVEVDVDTEVLVALAGLSTPHALRGSAAADEPPPMSAL